MVQKGSLSFSSRSFLPILRASDSAVTEVLRYINESMTSGSTRDGSSLIR